VLKVTVNTRPAHQKILKRYKGNPDWIAANYTALGTSLVPGGESTARGEYNQALSSVQCSFKHLNLFAPFLQDSQLRLLQTRSGLTLKQVIYCFIFFSNKKVK